MGCARRVLILIVSGFFATMMAVEVATALSCRTLDVAGRDTLDVDEGLEASSLQVVPSFLQFLHGSSGLILRSEQRLPDS